VSRAGARSAWCRIQSFLPALRVTLRVTFADLGACDHAAVEISVPSISGFLLEITSTRMLTKISMSPAVIAEKGADVLREMIQFGAQRLMDVEVEVLYTGHP